MKHEIGDWRWENMEREIILILGNTIMIWYRTSWHCHIKPRVLTHLHISYSKIGVCLVFVVAINWKLRHAGIWSFALMFMPTLLKEARNMRILKCHCCCTFAFHFVSGRNLRYCTEIFFSHGLYSWDIFSPRITCGGIVFANTISTCENTLIIGELCRR